MEHFYRDVPGWAAFINLYKMAVKEAPKDRRSHFVEIGSFKGRSAAFMAVEIVNSKKPIKFDCIDPWEDGGPDLKHKNFQPGELFAAFKKNTAPVKDIIWMIRQTSLEASKMYLNDSLDLVMIDGSHRYEDVKADIEAWLPKVRKGGILAGDDFNWSGVERAVRELLVDDYEVIVEELPKAKKASKIPAYWWLRK